MGHWHCCYLSISFHPRAFYQPSKIIMAVKVLALDATVEEQRQIKSELEILHKVLLSSLPSSSPPSLLPLAFQSPHFLSSSFRSSLLFFLNHTETHQIVCVMLILIRLCFTPTPLSLPPPTHPCSVILGTLLVSMEPSFMKTGTSSLSCPPSQGLREEGSKLSFLGFVRVWKKQSSISWVA